MALLVTDLEHSLVPISKGKVRDIYVLSEYTLLFIATDRISAYDVVMKNGIPDKGKFLTALSDHWFNILAPICRNHLIGTVTSLPPEGKVFAKQIEGRSMVVKRLTIFPIEAIVRGYLAGSAWSEYQRHGTVHGIEVPAGMVEGQAFEKPMFTPSTKSPAGGHDENIHPSTMAELIGEEHAKKIETVSLALYAKAQEYAAERGIIIADTKFEFGLDERDQVILADEVLTPDSSRFWLASEYTPGRPQESFDKQYFRDWLRTNGLVRAQDVVIPDDVVTVIAQKYKDICEMLTGSGV